MKEVKEEKTPDDEMSPEETALKAQQDKENGAVAEEVKPEEPPKEEVPPAEKGEEVKEPETPTEQEVVVTETPEEKIARLEQEKADLERSDKGKIGAIAELRDEIRLLKLEIGHKPAQSKEDEDLFKDRQDDDYVSVKEVKKLLERVNNQSLVTQDNMNLIVSEAVAKIRHTDYLDVIEKGFVKLADRNPSLWRLARFDPDPAEFMYQRGLTHPDFANKEVKPNEKVIKKEVIKKIVEQIEKPKIKKLAGGAGSALGEMTLDKVDNISPEDWAKLSPEVQDKLLRQAND